MEVKNYKELCKLLGCEERKSGKSKQLHHDDFSRYFEYHKQGHKYIIDAIYLKPLEKVDNREIYSNLIKQLVLSKLAKEHRKGNKIVTFSVLQLFEELYMVNKRYHFYNDKRSELSDKLDIDISYINDFYLSTYGKLNSSIKSALKSLDNKGIVSFKEEYIISLSYDDRTFTKVMNDSEIDLYNDYMGEYMTINNISDKRKLVLIGKWSDFNNYVIDRMSYHFKHDINYIFKAYKIYFNDRYIEELNSINEYLSINEKDVGKVLNQTIVDRYKLSYIDRYNNYIDRYIGMNEIDVVNMRKYEYNDMVIHIGKDKGIKLVDYTIDRTE